MNKIIIRVDISDKIGGGHLMRMIGLGQLLSDHGYEVHIASAFYKPNFIEPLLDSSFYLHLFDKSSEFQVESDLSELLPLAKKLEPEWIIIDGYHFSVGYEKAIRLAGFRCMRVDDLPIQRCEADVFLNHNHGAELFKLDLADHTIKLTGLKHLLIRRQFRQLDLRNKRVAKPGKIRLLVSLGGGSKVTDALNLKIVKALSQIKSTFEKATIVVGKMGKISEELLEASRESEFPITIIQYNENIAEMMFDSDLAITAGGYSMWELLYTGTPFIALSLNKAQDEYIRYLAQDGMCGTIGSHDNVSHDHIRETLLSFVNDAAKINKIKKKVGLLMDRENNGQSLINILIEKTYIYNSKI
jgi:UDP-2,4-diacetamido-2,4,6-trideoxy-beta-L-altropyranose hydrolase